MDRRHPRSSHIRLVRYLSDTEACIHSQCPSPSPVREKVCTCGNRCKLHSGSRSPSPTSSISSGFESGIRCRSCGGFQALKQEPSTQAETLTCSCSPCEIHIREARARSPINSLPSNPEKKNSEKKNQQCDCESCLRARSRPMRPQKTHILTPSSSDSSDYERTRRSQTRQPRSRRPASSPQAEGDCPIHSRPTTPASSTAVNSPNLSFAAMHAKPLAHRHCPQATYCEQHPELCRVSHAQAPNLARTQSRPPSVQSPQTSRERNSQHIRCTCCSDSSPEPVSPASGSSKFSTHVQCCGCASYAGPYFFDDVNWEMFGSEMASDSSVQARTGEYRENLESRCPFYHRCRPRFEGPGQWVCGRE